MAGVETPDAEVREPHIPWDEEQHHERNARPQCMPRAIEPQPWVEAEDEPDGQRAEVDPEVGGHQFLSRSKLHVVHRRIW